MRDRSRHLFTTAMMAALLAASQTSVCAFGRIAPSGYPFLVRTDSLYYPGNTVGGNVVGGGVVVRSRERRLRYPHHLHGRTIVVWHATTKGGSGDPLRAATGIRPSLHPTTINAIAEALKARARRVEGMTFRVTEDTDTTTPGSGVVRPIDVALTAGTIASTAITNRRKPSNNDGMTMTPEEEQTIAGRVLGVIMRLDELEGMLYERVAGVDWVQKYNEWNTFGVLESEEGEKEKDLVDDRIKNDPLFAVSRAECLLAIFLATVEVPQLKKVGEEVPDGSKIDFLDSDRMEVLLPEKQES